MDEEVEDFLDELLGGDRPSQETKKTSANKGNNSTPSAIGGDLTIKKTQKQKKDKKRDEDSFQEWLSESPRNENPAVAKEDLKILTNENPPALDIDEPKFEPLGSSERFQILESALEFSERETPTINDFLAEELPFIDVAKRYMKDENAAFRFIFACKL